MPQSAASWALGAWAAAVALCDLSRRRVPNVLLILLLVPAILAVTINGRGLLGAGGWESAAGFLIGGLPLLPGYALGHMGAGDVKFSACLGLLLGPGGALEMLLFGAALLGAVSVVLVLTRGSEARKWRIATVPMLAGAFGVQLAFGRLLTF